MNDTTPNIIHSGEQCPTLSWLPRCSHIGKKCRTTHSKSVCQFFVTICQGNRILMLERKWKDISERRGFPLLYVEACSMTPKRDATESQGLFTTPLFTPYNRSATRHLSFSPNRGRWLYVTNMVKGAHSVSLLEFKACSAE